MTSIIPPIPPPNENQKKVIDCPPSTIKIDAGAGTGKTKTICGRIARFINDGIDPKSIMLLTFTNNSAHNMKDRVEDYAGDKGNSIIAGTFHSVFYGYVKAHLDHFHFPKEVSLLSAYKTKSFFKLIKKEMRDLWKKSKNNNLDQKIRDLKNLEIYEGGSLYKVYNDIRISSKYCENFNLLEGIKWYIQEKTALEENNQRIYSLLAGIFCKFEHYKKTHFYIDFQDMQILFLQLLREKILDKELEKIQYLFVDEFQDVNYLQYTICEELSAYVQNYNIVGDPFQSIYRFRGSNPTLMIAFEDFHDTTLIPLVENYRSSQEILDYANGFMQNGKTMFSEKYNRLTSGMCKRGNLPNHIECLDKTHEMAYILSKILEHRAQGVPLHEQAILARTKNQINAFLPLLKRLRIPFEKRAGNSFDESKICKDINVFFSVFMNGKDFGAWANLLEICPNIGEISANKVIKSLKLGFQSQSLKRFAENINWERLGLTKRQIPSIRNLQKIIQWMFLKSDRKLGNHFEKRKVEERRFVVEIIKKIGEYLIENRLKYYKRTVLKLQQDIDSLILFAASYGQDYTGYVEDYLFQGDLVDNEDGVESEIERPLILSTVHRAKGLEWDIVYLCEVNKPIFPDGRSTEIPPAEEQRLFYVSVTRPRDHLYISYMIRGKNGNEKKPSEFLTYNPIETYDQISMPAVDTNDLRLKIEETPRSEQEQWLNNLPVHLNYVKIKGEMQPTKGKSFLFKIQGLNSIYLLPHQIEDHRVDSTKSDHWVDKTYIQSKLAVIFSSPSKLEIFDSRKNEFVPYYQVQESINLISPKKKSKKKSNPPTFSYLLKTK